MTQPTQTTPPIEFSGSAASATAHFPAQGRGLITTEVLTQLASACTSITDAATLAESGRDWWPLSLSWALRNETAALPSVVCQPRNTSEVSAVMRICNEAKIPVTPAGGRSGVTGASVPLYGGVLLDLTSLQGINAVDAVSGIVEVLPGTFGPDLESVLNAQHQLTVGHYPQSFDISTVGGWIACRGAGQFSTRYGKIEDMVVGLEVVLADGTVVLTGGAPAAAAGPDLTEVFLGSEGTLGVITRAWLRAHPLPEFRATAAYRFPTFAKGIEACRQLIRAGATPAVLRLYDGSESKRSHEGDGTQATLLVLDEGNEQLVTATMHIVQQYATSNDAIAADTALVEKWLSHRNDTSALQSLTKKGFVVDTIEVAAPWSQLIHVNDAVIQAILQVSHARSATCHLSHSYLDGACVYFTFAATPPAEEFEKTYVALWDAAQRTALQAGANLSHHHGVGLNRHRFMTEALGTGMKVLQSLKTTLDPNNILNPGKMGLSTGSNDAELWPVR
ncbi:MAG: FAD-binding oxidoreductase [Ilumatobacteraceae bacterium]|jgi:alkyldihydroxyacetonephosphate synthase|nr:FAD-binding oxidoreductase [Ilumatobacteraceae bacterium]MDP4701916.1 FAD-binding oxidoreductase [Ilumatobacteraceae bacterium]